VPRRLLPPRAGHGLPGPGVAVLATLALLVTACAGSEGSTAPSGPTVSAEIDSTTTAPEIALTTEAEADLVLYVSNQSFEDDTVRVRVAIDGVELVDQDFAVEGQHTWVTFPVALPAGEHVLSASSGTGAAAEESFEVPDGERRWAVLDYWSSPGGEPRSFTWHLSEEPIGFA
jgi:hypothetical protein